MKVSPLCSTVVCFIISIIGSLLIYTILKACKTKEMENASTTIAGFIGCVTVVCIAITLAGICEIIKEFKIEKQKKTFASLEVHNDEFEKIYLQINSYIAENNSREKRYREVFVKIKYHKNQTGDNFYGGFFPPEFKVDHEAIDCSSSAPGAVFRVRANLYMGNNYIVDSKRKAKGNLVLLNESTKKIDHELILKTRDHKICPPSLFCNLAKDYNDIRTIVFIKKIDDGKVISLCTNEYDFTEKKLIGSHIAIARYHLPYIGTDTSDCEERAIRYVYYKMFYYLSQL